MSDQPTLEGILAHLDDVFESADAAGLDLDQLLYELPPLPRDLADAVYGFSDLRGRSPWCTTVHGVGSLWSKSRETPTVSRHAAVSWRGMPIRIRCETRLATSAEISAEARRDREYLERRLATYGDAAKTGAAS